MENPVEDSENFAGGRYVTIRILLAGGQGMHRGIGHGGNEGGRSPMSGSIADVNLFNAIA